MLALESIFDSLTTSKNRYFLLILLPLILTGCLGTQHLKENEKHLFRQSIKASENIDEEALRNLYAQRPNRRFLGLPIYHLVAVYYNGLRHYDKQKYIRKKERTEKKFNAKVAKTTSTKKINNLQFRKQKKLDKLDSYIESGNLRMQWGEPIAVYDSALVKLTIDRFTNYLFSEGYFHNNVSTKITTIGKFVSINYRVETGPPYIIDTIIYNISDEKVLRTLKDNQKSSLVKAGDRYSEDKLTKERERIDLFLKDNGFFDFSRQYVEWRADTAMKKNKVELMLIVHNPAKRGYHKQFTIDSVKFVTDAGVVLPGMKRRGRTYRDVQYKYYNDNYSLKILSQRMSLMPGNLYSRQATFNSQRQLANLDAFKFVNINYDTARGKFIANIFTSPLERYEWSNEVGVNVTQGYPGPFYNINLKKRNIFKGLENFELNGRIGFEGVASATHTLNAYKSTQAGLNASLIFPQFIWPLREATQLRFGKYNPKTRLSLGYNYTDRPEYQRSATTLSNTYTWQNKRATQYSLTLTNVSLINSKKSPAFRDLLDALREQGNYSLYNSFNPSFVSSMIFGITWNKDYGTFDRNAIFIRAQFESGGTSLNFIDPERITKRSTWLSKDSLQYFKYLRFNFDVRKIRILSKWATLAYRINTGVAYSYGDNQTLPYEKFYFAGGSNSVRAWRPRRLGLGSVSPGATSDPANNGTFNYQFEKPGEILLEGSVELRSKLIGFVDGAVFIDAGNVWNFRKPTTETGTGNSQFSANSFYKELGIGTGFGLRFDFTFLILRFDVGIKAYDPARDPGDRFVLDDARLFGPYAKKIGENQYTNIKEPAIYNVGIGFPF
jgi:outer membrane protein insertion porin family